MKHTLKIICSEKDQLPFLEKVVNSTGLFPGEYLGGMMQDYFENKNSTDRWLTGLLNDKPVAIAYYAPEKLTQGTFNLYLIAIDKDFQNKGLGAELIEYIEHQLASSGSRILIVETSGLESFENTRNFYLKCGYNKEAIIRDFYQEGEDKIVFWKKLNSFS
ncbi:GNAT family N-acetyltransferase [Flavihumibacter cheonanensis]|uniref:GNAT family N-acetyltransferase n=1 Tax=Flavihumibacter cheonanensis TaxID=1442385 RepID=UPI001EF79C83|nr:GNAT family N-acetyltransferase [Flavihumibacter cheonanensis]MCG7752784.1 GNAT family N-acetyltransferase [Flavihumibacter cheonanensis]